MKPFLDALAERVLVCDGAMGTMLYGRGVFINRCFDALNLTTPDVVSDVHQDYIRAGADVIETNTFGANRVKLRAFGLSDRIREINFAGARLARKAANGRAYVAGAMGPLGIRVEPWGKTGVDEAEVMFREQAQGLADGGVDLFILETFRDLNELGAAIAAVRRVCALPIVAQMTIEDDGNTLDGTPPEQFAPALEARGANVIGVNCSIGPAPMLETIDRLAQTTRIPLSAQPNAGKPRDIEGRNIYLSSPEYMASYARRFVTHGVRLVGGCCGTTPEHIRQIKIAVKSLAPELARAAASRGTDSAPAAVAAADSPRQPPIARAEKSELANALASRRFITIVSLVPPKGFAAEEPIAQARALKIRGVDVITIPDARGARLSALSLSVLVQQRAGIEAVLEYSCRDRNLIGMQSDLLGAHAMGVRNLLIITGDARSVGDYPDATAVFDVDSIGLTNVVSRLNTGVDVGGQPIGSPTAFHAGVMVNPAAETIDAELRRFEYKVEAGAEFAITQPIFDVAGFERCHKRLAAFRIPIILGLRPFESVLNAEFMANEVPGVTVPDAVLDRMRGAAGADAAAAEGIAIAREVGRALKGLVQGIHVSTPSGNIDTALDVLDGLR